MKDKTILVHFRGDSHFTVSTDTWRKVAKLLGMSEEDAIQMAMAKLAGEQIKDFPFDDPRAGRTDFAAPGKTISKLDLTYFNKN